MTKTQRRKNRRPAFVENGCLNEQVSFHMVWTKTGHPPTYVHGTYGAAKTEAERLATKNPGKKFIVLSAQTKHSFVGSSIVETVAPGVLNNLSEAELDAIFDPAPASRDYPDYSEHAGRVTTCVGDVQVAA